MEYVRLGSAGLSVSRLCLGCMSYGLPGATFEGAPMRWDWALNEADSKPFFRQALESGINFFDTANVYSYGASEEVTGRALKEYAKREDVVLATKAWGVMRPGPNGGGLSRKAIFHELDASLKRLGTDYVDLYQIHRWDPETPIEETMRALHDVVRAGKVRYLGASSMRAWQFAKAQQAATLGGWTPFISMQNHYNLLFREEEREMNPLCADQGVGLIPWSPLARGRLARGLQGGGTPRSEHDRFGKAMYGPNEQADLAVLEAVTKLALARGLSTSQVALAWLMQRPGVAAPIVGATKLEHLKIAVASVGLKLDPSEIASLEAPYQPHAGPGF